MRLSRNGYKSLISLSVVALSLLSTACGDTGRDVEWALTGPRLQSVEAARIDGIDLVALQAELAVNQVAPGEQVAVHVLVANQGSLEAPASRIKYYLSMDAELGSDTYRNYDRVSGLSAGENGPEQANVRIPSDWAEGVSYILVVVDANDDALEVNETNNVVVLPLTVSSEPVVVEGDAPDLLVSATSLMRRRLRQVSVWP